MKKFLVKFGSSDKAIEVCRTAYGKAVPNAVFAAIKDLQMNLGWDVLAVKDFEVLEVVDMGEIGAAAPPSPKVEAPSSTPTTAAPPQSDAALSTLRQRVHQFLGVFEKDKEKARAIFKAVSGKERTHDCTELELRGLITAFAKLAEGSAGLVWAPDKKGAGIVDGPTGAVLAGAAPVAPGCQTKKAQDPF